jgi:hypothetical protein
MTDDDATDLTEQAENARDPMTDSQRIYLDTLSDQVGEPTPDDHLSKAEATRKIEELREEAGYDTSTDDLDEP